MAITGTDISVPYRVINLMSSPALSYFSWHVRKIHPMNYAYGCVVIYIFGYEIMLAGHMWFIHFYSSGWFHWHWDNGIFSSLNDIGESSRNHPQQNTANTNVYDS